MLALKLFLQNYFNFALDDVGNGWYYRASVLVGFPSGQRGQTVNLLRELRRFESFSHHHI